MRPLTTVLLLALFAPSGGAADDPKDAAKKLEGTYEVREVLAGGKPDQDDVKSVEIKDGRIIPKGKTEEKAATFTLDPSQKPAHIDISPGNDKKIPGIYEVKETDKGTELIIAFSRAKDATRPKDFKGTGDEDMVVKLFRKKAK